MGAIDIVQCVVEFINEISSRTLYDVNGGIRRFKTFPVISLPLPFLEKGLCRFFRQHLGGMWLT
jgi:hypothetical protein